MRSRLASVCCFLLLLLPAFASARPAWIWLPDPQPATTNVYARFRTELPAGADALRLSVSGNYAVRLGDGDPVAFGQCCDFPTDKRWHEWPLAVAATNRVLTVDVYFSGNRFSSHLSGEPGLWAQVLKGGLSVNESSSAWQVAPLDAYEFGPRTILFVSLDYTWAYDARRPASAFVPAAVLERPPMDEPRAPAVRPPEDLGVVAAKTVGAGPGWRVFDFGGEVTGHLLFAIDSAADGQRFEIVHGEYLKDGRVQDFEIRGNAGNPRRVVDTYVARAGRQTFEHALRRYGLRYLEFRWTGGGEPSIAPALRQVGHRDLATPPFRCSDPLFERIFEMCCRTLRCCLHEKYENCPWREQSICAYDARNQMLFGYPLWGNYDRAAEMIRLFGEAERDHGYIAATTPSAMGTVIPSFTFAWIVSACEHAWYSGDDTVLREQLPRIRRMLGRIMARRAGKLCTIPDELPGAWVWNYCEPGELEFCGNPPNAFYNLYLHEALTALAAALGRMGEPDADRYAAAARELGDACEVYWDEARGLYANERTPDGARASFYGHVQALFLAEGLVPRERVPRVIGAMRDGRVKLPELSAFPYLVKGVFACGTDDDRRWLHGKIREIYGGMLDAGATTCWESLQGTRYAGGGGSLCHGWAAFPVWYAAEYLVGVRPTAPGYSSYEVCPRVEGVRATLQVFTPRGREIQFEKGVGK